MKTPDMIRERVQTMLLLELNARITRAGAREPHRCQHNHRQELDPRKKLKEEPNPGYNRLERTDLPVVRKIGLCMYGAQNPTEWPGDICDDVIDAQRCPLFQPKVTKEEIMAEFRSQIEDMSWIQSNMPEVYGLLWALDVSSVQMTMPWWKRLFFWVLKIRVEPITTSAQKLLEQGHDGFHGS